MHFSQAPFLAAVVTVSLLSLSSAQTSSKPLSTLTGLSIGSSPTNAANPSPPTAARIIPVVVGSPTLNKSLAFTPNEVTAAPGSVIQFQFSQINHTVTQSSFAAPCQPIQESNPSAAGIHSGFIAAGDANTTTVQTFDVPINDTKPIYIYCAQGPHCMLGMVMVINSNANETFAAYKAASAKAKANVPAKLFRGGVLGSIPKADAVSPPV